MYITKIGLWETYYMFNVILLGGIGSIMGVGAGYLILNAVFAGVQHIAKPNLDSIKTKK